MADMPARIELAHDQPIFGSGQRHILGSGWHLAVVGEADTDAQAVALAAQHGRHLQLLDCWTPHGHGLSTPRAIASRERRCAR
jgi:DNA-binding NarL/FixJ family response regulator